ncbi:unnamed protein product [Amoebophrya sp. A120]|nr:unnamed protein product [Amoebophrya sp. A120]|eukprot:GSA120T00012185001.1
MEPRRTFLFAVKAGARMIIRAVENFQSSRDAAVHARHVASKEFFKKKWAKALGEQWWAQFAKELWERASSSVGDVGVTHDCYLKWFQISQTKSPALSRAANSLQQQAQRCPSHPEQRLTLRSGPGGHSFYGCSKTDDRGHFACNYKKPADGYDVIIMDEGQDLTPCQFEAFVLAEPRTLRYVVGDVYQRIFGFRGAKDDFEKCPNVFRDFDLTASFRYGRTIAEAAQRVLGTLRNCGTDGQTRTFPSLVGAAAEDGSERVAPVSELDYLETREQVAILCKSNKGIADALLAVLKTAKARGQEMPRWKYLVSGPSLKPERFAKLVALYKQEPGAKVEYEGVVFEDWQELSSEVEESGSPDWLTRVGLVEDNDGDVLELFQELEAAHVAAKDQTANWKICLSTVHKAKGLEFEHAVIIGNDFKTIKLPEYARLLYIAITRARRRCYFSENPWNLLEGLGQKPASGTPAADGTFDSTPAGDHRVELPPSLEISEQEWAEYENTFDAWQKETASNGYVSSPCPLPPQRKHTIEKSGQVRSNYEFFFVFDEREISWDDQLDRLGELIKRYHPDKLCRLIGVTCRSLLLTKNQPPAGNNPFAQRVTHVITEETMNRITEGAVASRRQINGLRMTDSRGEEEEG